MLAAVSRDESILRGGIGPSKWTGRGTVVVEPLARLTPSGEWEGLPCGPGHLKTCAKFGHDYLNRPHTYTVVSADGYGATIHAAPATLNECYDFSGVGDYSGAPIARSAIAASSDDFFGISSPPQSLDNQKAAPIRKSLEALVPGRLDSVQGLRLFALRLEDQDVVVVQRDFADLAAAQKPEETKLIFGIGTMDHSLFHVLRWTRDPGDEDERVLGTIHLKSGRDFLITAVSDPESRSFRVYGIRNGHLTLVFSGGGSSC